MFLSSILFQIQLGAHPLTFFTREKLLGYCSRSWYLPSWIFCLLESPSSILSQIHKHFSNRLTLQSDMLKSIPSISSKTYNSSTRCSPPQHCPFHFSSLGKFLLFNFRPFFNHHQFLTHILCQCLIWHIQHCWICNIFRKDIRVWISLNDLVH